MKVTARAHGRARWWGLVVIAVCVAVSAGVFAVVGGGNQAVTGAPRADAAAQLRDRLSVFDRPADDADRLPRDFQGGLEVWVGPQDVRLAAEIDRTRWNLVIQGNHLCVIQAQTANSGSTSCTTADLVLKDQHMISRSGGVDEQPVITMVLLDGCVVSDANTTELWQQDNVAVFTADASPDGFLATLTCPATPDLDLDFPTQDVP